MNRIIEIVQDGRHLSTERGFMLVSERGTELGRVPLDQIDAVIANAHGTSYSNNLLVKLAEQNAPLVICAANHVPVAVLTSLADNHLQSEIIRKQASIKETTLNRLWKDVVVVKIKQQAAVLNALGLPDIRLQVLAAEVRSGDPENKEGTAARYYFKTLFGPDFKRDRAVAGTNAMLNYGYMILRSCVIRSVIAAGLHPSLGMHHHNQYNPMCLADDLMEPFRPITDFLVYKMIKSGQDTLDVDAKKKLVSLMSFNIETHGGIQELNYIIQRLAVSFVGVLRGEKDKLDFPPIVRGGLFGIDNVFNN